jgi:S1-C subfamily serine protease
MSELLAAILMAVAVLAPVPADPRPDPLAWGYLGVRFAAQGSVQIGNVEPGTPAAKAGIQPGDDLVKIGNLRARQYEQVVEYISSLRPGTVVKVEVMRNGEKKEFTVKLGVRPAEAGTPPRQDRLPIPLPKE